MKKTYKLLCLVWTLCLFCACGDAQDNPEGSEASVERPQTQITHALEVDGWRLALGASEPYSYEFSAMLTALDGSYASSLVGTAPDMMFLFEVNDPDSVLLELSLDPGAKTAQLTVQKNTLLLDFEAGSQALTVAYRASDIGPDDELSTSADGALTLCRSYLLAGDAGEISGDAVVRDNETGAIWYLAVYDGYQQAFFCGGTDVLFNRVDALELLDARTGEASPNAPAFEYGLSQVRRGLIAYYTVGACWDGENERLLVAYRDSLLAPVDGVYAMNYPLYVDVFDAAGVKLQTLDTGFEVADIFGPTLNPVEFELLGGGQARLYSHGAEGDSWGAGGYDRVELGTIEYE